MADTQNKGSNLTDEDRAKGGKNSHKNSSSMKESQSGQGKGNFGDHEEHSRAGKIGGSK